MSRELSLGLDSFVFVDDNPAERAIVAAQLPMVAVPDVGDDPARFVDLLDRQLYFEPIGLSAEDLARSGYYASNVQRNVAQGAFADYGGFLDSLEMRAEVAPFAPTYMERIVQLTNKTNQFNLTTSRFTAGEMEVMRTGHDWITLYGRLADKFGDNGLVTIVAGRVVEDELDLVLWLMSCRVLKRDLERLMLDEIAARAAARGLKALRGTYAPTAKNALVADHYELLGFELVDRGDSGGTVWRLSLVDPYLPRNTHIAEVARG
jgi:FkbH-like protein